jgi:glycosyltransferase involved in cell wall biosynthesis
LPRGLPDDCDAGVLFGVGDLSAGGAQMFAVRFVNEWAKLPAPVVLFNAEHELENPATLAALSPEVPTVNQRDIDAAGGLSSFMHEWGLKIVVSDHWWGNRAVGKMMSAASHAIPWITVMHGCHENVLSAPKSFPTMIEDFVLAEKYCDHWVWTAEKNKQVFETGSIKPKAMSHIVNGFSPSLPSAFRIKRSDIGIHDDALVFALASRAIESKGWDLAIEAFEELKISEPKANEIHLLLIGDGPVSDRLRLKSLVDGVHLVKHTSQLADYIHISDVCLLLSSFPGESLPLVLLEFLAQGKPAVVSDIGMCAWAIKEGTTVRPAGVVLERDRKTGKVPRKLLTDTMRRFVADENLKHDLGISAQEAFGKFHMSGMVESYRALIHNLLQEARPR